MAKTINQRQKELLETDFLNLLGENPNYDDLPLENVARAIALIAGTLLGEVEKNINEGGHVGDGSLLKSFKAINARLEGSQILVDIEALAYYQFLNKGVKGTKGGSGEFAFKSDKPSIRMIESVRRWMKNAGISSESTRKYSPISKLEKKRNSISSFDKAYAVARSIKQKGIKPTGFFDKAFEVADNFANQELGVALKIDIINALPDKLDGK